jgi:2-iminobutanoate/2-iminopropanoate deaminase
MKYVQTEKAPKAVGPYSQAIVENGLIYCSGQIGLHPQTGELVEGLENQTHQVIKNLQAVLQEAGSDLDQILKTTIFITNIADFAKVNEIYGQYFVDHKPARATVAVSDLPKGAVVEIEAIAIPSPK